MNFALFRQKLKPWMLPIAMLGGVIFHDFIHYLQPIAPYLIFIMLLITFCKVRPSEIRLTGFSWILLAIQILGSLAVYFILLPFGKDLAIGTFICVFCPTATAAPVITGMLGGSIPRLATFSILSNFAVALLAPVLFTLMGSHHEFGFLETTVRISIKVVPLILAPLFLAIIMLKTVPKVHAQLAKRQDISFYIWSVSLFIVVGNAVSFMISHHENIPEMVALGLLSLLVCLIQFGVGRIVGRKFGDKIAGAQGLGQKNTVLAIWMALMFFHPVTSVAPAAYVAWQNTINSLQLYFKSKKSVKELN